MTVKEELARSREDSNWIDTSIHSLQIESGDREVMAGALFDQGTTAAGSRLLILKFASSSLNDLAWASVH